MAGDTGFNFGGGDDFGLGAIFEKLKDPQVRDEMLTELAQQGPAPVDGGGGGFAQAGLPPAPGQAPQFVPPVGGATGAQVPIQGLGGAPILQPQAINPTGGETDLAGNKNSWEKFLTFMESDEGRRTALDFASKVVRPAGVGESGLSVIGDSLRTSVEGLESRRAGRAAAESQAVKDAAALAKTKAETGNIEADTGITGRKERSLDFTDDLKAAQAALARARAQNVKDGGESGKGGTKIALENMRANAWLNANPGKFVDLDDARADLIRFETTKGNPPFQKAIEALMQDLPVWRADKLKPIIDLVKQESADAQVRPVSPRKQLEVNVEQLEGFSTDDWARVAGDEAIRKKLEKAFGAEEISKRLQQQGF